MTVRELLEQLVRIDSVNPGLDPSGAGETEIARFVADWGRAEGLRTEIVESTPGRPSVVLRGGRDTGGRRLLLCGHLDTVGLAGALVPRVEGDRLYARGAYDMKAGLAAALIACRDASRSGIDGEVVVAAVADEEVASLGIQDVLAHLDLAGIDAAVVTEPTERQVGTAHRGFVWTEVTVTGVAAHGSRPHLGADAILAAGHHLVAFDELDRHLRDRPHPFLGPGNLHASLISGGTEESTIPDRCVFTVERRTLPGETLDRVEADVADLLERCRPADPRLEVTARTVLHRNAMETPHSEPIVRMLLDAAGSGTTAAPMSYWADSAFLADAGIPTVLYGPEGEGAHADVEWVSLSGTSTAATVLTGLARTFCSSA
ncbi:M20/M25/M40 family metallo-hydrolase [Lentzea aerocolonigenes]|uniref:M20/M25/M40 family metallo-hydrolase n=1 Tax=Lentzea aerocolonigenes TaxID=68170 RepID=UPI0004C3A794|nr:M20/M25/M40 family metallo-hydrolase [Lentzea aerocolonigenes]MCP2246621.1 acetylornithine deacetylase [Lentzea aerocolonigenes]